MRYRHTRNRSAIVIEEAKHAVLSMDRTTSASPSCYKLQNNPDVSAGAVTWPQKCQAHFWNVSKVKFDHPRNVKTLVRRHRPSRMWRLRKVYRYTFFLYLYPRNLPSYDIQHVT